MAFRYSIALVALVSMMIISLAAVAPSDPWNDSQIVQPAALHKELADAKTAPTVLFVGFGRLYTAGHIKGAQFHGSGGSPDGLAHIKAWAASIRTSTNLVIYCGCCPMERCPNLRPAFTALSEMGFSKLRVLILPTDFAKDWADQGFPFDKGQ
jgi:hypothetical protein